MSLCLACLLPVLSAVPGSRAAAVPAMEWIRVGLYFGDAALAAANLENHTNSGYSFGYTDTDFVFHPLACTDTAMTQITMLKTQNMYYGGGSSYSTSDNGGTAVGCYHIQTGSGYSNYEEAAAAAEGYSGGFVAWIQGEYQVRVGAYTSKDAALEARAALGLEDAAIVGTSSYGINVVATKSAKILFQFDGGAELPLTVRPGLKEETKPITWFKGYRYYGDFRYERIDGGNLTVVSLINMDDYINCVISQEMSKSWPVEALKAQAVCARTYAEMNRNKHKKYNFDLCATTDCQAYIGGMARTDSVTETAASETAGVRAWYDGKMAETFYFSSSGGATEDVRNVWGGTTEYPYLIGVEDPYELSIESEIEAAYGSRNYRWTITYTKKELAELLRSKGYQCADIVDFRVSEFSPTGNVVTLTFLDSAGKSYSFSGEKAIRTWMGAPSFRYTVSGGGKYYVNEKGDYLSSVNGVYAIGAGGALANIGLSEMPYILNSAGGTEQLAVPGDTFTISGAGWGHNVGMSQWGAYAMAKQGKTYDEILKFYFTGIELY